MQSSDVASKLTLSVPFSSMNTAKRRPSRSPEGATSQRKFSRQGSPTSSHLIDPTADPRRNVTGGADESSLQSRPQRPPQAVMTNGQGSIANAASASPLREVVQALVSELAERASIQNFFSIAEKKLEKCENEYTANENQFSKFPPVKERLTKRRDEARDAAHKLERQLQEKKITQERIASRLEQAILEMPLLAPKPENGSRENFEILQRSHESLQRSHETLQERFDRQQECCEKQQVTIDGLKSSFESLRKDVAAGVKKTADVSLQTMQAVDKRATPLEQRASNVESLIKSVKKDSQTKAEDERNARKSMQSEIDGINASTKENTTHIKGLRISLESSRPPPGPTLAQFSELQRLVTDLEKDPKVFKEALGQNHKQASTGSNVVPQYAGADFATRSYVDQKFQERDDWIDSHFAERDKLISDSMTTAIADLRTTIEALLEAQSKQAGDLNKKDEEFQNLSQEVATMTKTLEELQSKQTVLADAVQKRLSQPTATAPTAPNPTPQFNQISSPTTPNLPHANGVNSLTNASLPGRPNGTSVPPRTSPWGTGVADLSGQNIAALQRTIEALQNEHKGTAAHVHHLKHRFDNLTTDELVQRMGDQFSRMYPAASDFQAVVKSLSAALRDHDDKMATLEAFIGTPSASNNTLHDRLSSLEQNANSLRIDLDHFRNQMPTNNSGDLEPLKKAVQSMNNTVQLIKQNLDNAKAAIQGLKTEVSTDVKAQNELIAKLEGQSTILQGSLAGIRGNLSSLEGNDIEELRDGALSLSGRVTSTNERVSKLDKRISDLKEDVTTIENMMITK